MSEHDNIEAQKQLYRAKAEKAVASITTVGKTDAQLQTELDRLDTYVLIIIRDNKELYSKLPYLAKQIVNHRLGAENRVYTNVENPIGSTGKKKRGLFGRFFGARERDED